LANNFPGLCPPFLSRIIPGQEKGVELGLENQKKLMLMLRKRKRKRRGMRKMLIQDQSSLLHRALLSLVQHLATST